MTPEHQGIYLIQSGTQYSFICLCENNQVIVPDWVLLAQIGY